MVLTLDGLVRYPIGGLVDGAMWGVMHDRPIRPWHTWHHPSHEKMKALMKWESEESLETESSIIYLDWSGHSPTLRIPDLLIYDLLRLVLQSHHEKKLAEKKKTQRLCVWCSLGQFAAWSAQNNVHITRSRRQWIYPGDRETGKIGKKFRCEISSFYRDVYLYGLRNYSAARTSTNSLDSGYRKLSSGTFRKCLPLYRTCNWHWYNLRQYGRWYYRGCNRR